MPVISRKRSKLRVQRHSQRAQRSIRTLAKRADSRRLFTRRCRRSRKKVPMRIVSLRRLRRSVQPKKKGGENIDELLKDVPAVWIPAYQYDKEKRIPIVLNQTMERCSNPNCTGARPVGMRDCKNSECPYRRTPGNPGNKHAYTPVQLPCDLKCIAYGFGPTAQYNTKCHVVGKMKGNHKIDWLMIGDALNLSAFHVLIIPVCKEDSLDELESLMGTFKDINTFMLHRHATTWLEEMRYFRDEVCKQLLDPTSSIGSEHEIVLHDKFTSGALRFWKHYIKPIRPKMKEAEMKAAKEEEEEEKKKTQ